MTDKSPRSNRLKIAAAVVLGIALFAAMADWGPPEENVLVGYWMDGQMQEAPAFTLPALDGGELSLADLRGQVVVLNFWATWCAPCRVETPAFVQLQDRLAASGVQFVGISIDYGGMDTIRPFAEQYGVNYPLLLDTDNVYGRYVGATGVPTTYLINREGRIWRYMPGALPLRELESMIRQLL